MTMASLVVLSALLGGLGRISTEVQRRIDIASCSSLLGVTSNVINSVIGGGSAQGLAFTPRRVELHTSGDEVRVEVGNITASLRFPVNLTPCHALCWGLTKLEAKWRDGKVALSVGGG